MATKDKALKMAIEALENAQKELDGQFSCGNCYTNVIQTCKEALEQHSGDVVVTKNEQGQIVCVTRQDAEGNILSVIAESEQPAQEPYKFIHPYYGNLTEMLPPKEEQIAPSWQGLSDDEIEKIYADTEPDSKLDTYYIVLSRAIEQALRNKNGS